MFLIYFMKPRSMLLSFIMTLTLPSSYMNFSPIFSQAIFISQLSRKFSKAANLFEILSRLCSLTSTSLKFSRQSLHIKLVRRSFNYKQSIPKFGYHQTVISIRQLPHPHPQIDRTLSILECHFLSIRT